jgi:hypothetical protein
VYVEKSINRPIGAAAAKRPRRRWLAGAAWAVAALAGFAIYFRLASTTATNSDGSGQALQAWSLLHGNLLLHGWMTTDVPLSTTEVPEYALVEAVHGLGAGVVHIAAAITYTMVVLLVAALAKGTASGREAVARIAIAVGIIFVPELVWGTHELLSSPDHIGTCVPVMVAWLVVDRCRPRWWVPVITSGVLAWTVIADEVALVIAVAPLVGVCAIRCLRSPRRWYELSLAAGGVIAAALGLALPHAIRALGGYTSPPVLDGLSPLHTIIHHNLPITGKDLLILFGAYLPGQAPGAFGWFAMLHVVGLALVACGVVVTAWRFLRGGEREIVPQVLLAGIVVVVGIYIVGTNATVLENAREFSSVVPFGAILAGRQLAPALTRPIPARGIALSALGVVLAGYVAGLGLELTVHEAPPMNSQLAAWLEKHPLGGTGLSGYWEANVVTLTSGSSVGVRPVNVTSGRVIPHGPNTQASWWDPASSYADFVVLGPPDNPYGYPGFTNRKAVVATFGKPARVYHAGPYTILWWHKNLLDDLDVAARYTNAGR